MRREMVIGSLFASVVLALPMACEKEPDPAIARARETKKKREILEKYRQPVDDRLKRIAVLTEGIDAWPLADDDAAAPKPSPAIVIRLLHWDDPHSNADVMMRWELGYLQRGILGTCAFYQRSGEEDDVTSDLLQDVFEGCARMRWFLVFRPGVRVKPTLTADHEKYAGGYVSGDVLVFDLAATGTPALVGSFPLSTELSKPVEVRVDDDDRIKSYTLDEALREEVVKAVETKLHAP